VEDIRLIVSEATTNAMRAAERYAIEVRRRPWEPHEKPVALRVECRSRWTHLLVIDPDPRPPEPAPRDFLDEFGGRGLAIIESVAALMWMVPGKYGKTFHVVVTHPGVELTPDEKGALMQRVIM
jgi:anti-sigma regulatory factor (Ser/Thr protein kinase)